MKVEKVKKLKNGKYKIIFDNDSSLITYDDIIINNMLFDGKKVDNAILSNISIDNAFYDVYNKLVKMISVKWRSQKEIVAYMEKNDVSVKDQAKIIDKLLKNGLLNDTRYANCYALDAINLSKNGPYKIRQNLEEQGIPEDIINETIANIDYEEIGNNLKIIIEKKVRLNHKHSSFQLKTKLYNELISLGYDAKDINDNLNKMVKSDSTIAKKEYDRLYKKYSKKYSGNELNYKIKQTLYQKGFNYSEIE